MSVDANTQLLERAAEVMDYFQSTTVESVIEKLIQDNDFDQLYLIVTDMEAEMARQEFFNNDVMGETDEY